MRYIGVDLAWGEKETTGLAVLDDDGSLIADDLKTDLEDVVAFVSEHGGEECLVGVDAPLVVKNRDSCRDCERQLLKRKISLYPSNRTWIMRIYGRIRGEEFVSALSVEGYNLTDRHPSEVGKGLFIYEVYPRSVLRYHYFDEPSGKVIAPKYKFGKKANIEDVRRGVAELRDGMDDLELPISFDHKALTHPIDDTALSTYGRKELKAVGDLLDAILSAYMVYWARHFGNMAGEIVGRLNEGSILVPPDFARDLCRNYRTSR